MKRHINFGSIKQFRDIVRDIEHLTRFEGKDVRTGKNIYNNNPLPVLTISGTEKIHGTNGAVCFNKLDGFWVQSKKKIITPEKDNAGCAFFCYQNEDAWKLLIHQLSSDYEIDLDKYTITIYFEFAGGNIQKNSACSGLDKRAIILRRFKVSPINEESEEVAKWRSTFLPIKYHAVDYTDRNIFNILNYPKYEIKVDFNNPQEAVNTMLELVDEIEKESPVGKAMGVDGNIGEGIVFEFWYKDTLHRFKVKGEKHAKGSGKVKTLKPVDTEKEKKKVDFVNNYACQEFRLDQMFTEIQNSKYNGDETQMSKKDIGDYLRLVFNDVLKEESNKLAELGLEPKEVSGMISKVAKDYFIDRLERF